MNCRRSRSLLIVLGGLLLAACGSAPAPSGAQGNAAVPDRAGALGNMSARGGAGVKAFIDPVTGELRAPTAVEQRAAAAAAGGSSATSGASVKATAPIEGKPVGNGMIQYDIGKRGMVDEVVCIRKDGTVTGSCPKPAR